MEMKPIEHCFVPTQSNWPKERRGERGVRVDEKRGG